MPVPALRSSSSSRRAHPRSLPRRWAREGLLLAVLAAGLMRLTGCGGDSSPTGDLRAVAAHDSLTAALDRARGELAWAEGEVRAARGPFAYLVLDLPGNLLRLDLAGVTFDSLRIEKVRLDAADLDSLRLAPFRWITAAETLVVQAARLEADTTRDKSAAALARILPPRPRALRYVLHAEGVTVRFTADDPPGFWSDVKLRLSRSYGTSPSGAAPSARIDVEVAGADLSRLDHFVEAGMPLLLRFGSD